MIKRNFQISKVFPFQKFQQFPQEAVFLRKRKKILLSLIKSPFGLLVGIQSPAYLIA